MLLCKFFCPSWCMRMLLFSVRLVFRSVIFRISTECPSIYAVQSFISRLQSDLFCFVPQFPSFSDGFFFSHTRPRPSSATLFCLAARFPFVFLSTSFCPVKWTLFCAAASFVVRLTSFCSAFGPRPPQSGFLLFRAAVFFFSRPHSFVSRTTFFGVRSGLPFVSCAITFDFIAQILLLESLAALCLRHQPNNEMQYELIICLCLANLSFCISRYSSGFAYAVPLIFAIQDGELFRVYGDMSSFWDETSSLFRNTVLRSESLCDQEPLFVMVAARKRQKHKKRAVKTSAFRTAKQGQASFILKNSGSLQLTMERFLNEGVQPASWMPWTIVKARTVFVRWGYNASPGNSFLQGNLANISSK